MLVNPMQTVANQASVLEGVCMICQIECVCVSKYYKGGIEKNTCWNMTGITGAVFVCH